MRPARVVRVEDERLVVAAALGRCVLVMAEHVLKVRAGLVHLLGPLPQGVDAALDDLRPFPGGVGAGQDVGDLLQAHLPAGLPVPDGRQAADLVRSVPAAARPPGGGLEQPALLVVAHGRGPQAELPGHLVDRYQPGF